MSLEIDFSNAVRVLATSDEQTIIQFCKDSGAIDSILGFKDSCDVGDSILFIRFKRLSSVLDLKRRSKSVELGGRSVLVETIADSPILQEQCKMICKATPCRTHCTPFSARFSRTFSDKENYPQSSLNRPSSAPVSKLVPFNAWRILNDEIKPGRIRPASVTRLDPRQLSRARSFSYRTNSDESMATTVEGLSSPLCRSPTIFRERARSNLVQPSRGSVLSPSSLRRDIAAPRRAQSLLIGRSRSSTRSGETVTLRNTAEETQKKYMKSSISTIRKELEEAKERYSRSLEIVKGHLAMMEKRYNI